MKNNAYLLNYTTSEEKIESLGDYYNKVIVIFNGAIFSPFAASFFSNMQDLYSCYQDELEIINFPTSAFFNQNAYSTSETITYLKKEYNITYKTAKKIDDDIRNEVFFNNLCSSKKFSGFDITSPLYQSMVSIVSNIDPLFDKNNKVKWSFTTFIISKNGEIVKRFECTADFAKIEQAIRRELNK